MNTDNGAVQPIVLSDHARKVLTQVRDLFIKWPEVCQMSHWARETSCGTVGCIAGWSYAVTHPGAHWREIDDNALDFIMALLNVSYARLKRVVYTDHWPADLQAAYHAVQDKDKSVADTRREWAAITVQRINRLLESGL